MPTDTPWTKATASNPKGACVQVRLHHGRPEVRDSKNPDGPILELSPASTGAWLDAARSGELDHLAH